MYQSSPDCGECEGRGQRSKGHSDGRRKPSWSVHIHCTHTAHTNSTQTHAALAQEPGEMLTRLSSLVHSASRDPVLLVGEQDLLRDSTLFLWETVRPAFSQLHSNLPAATRPLTASRRGREVGQECVYV